jgi:hypothetical protein
MGGQAMKSSKSICNVATLIERYFTERLMRQRNISANTIASYRDTFRLLFSFAQVRLRKPPSALSHIGRTDNIYHRHHISAQFFRRHVLHQLTRLHTQNRRILVALGQHPKVYGRTYGRR